METIGLIKSFLDLDEATRCYENTIRDFLLRDYEIDKAEIVYVNFHYRVGIQGVRNEEALVR